jgi:hypothetical protein
MLYAGAHRNKALTARSSMLLLLLQLVVPLLRGWSILGPRGLRAGHGERCFLCVCEENYVACPDDTSG